MLIFKVLSYFEFIQGFQQFLTNVSKKYKTVIEIYVYASESVAHLENGIGYFAMTKSLEDISV